MSAASPIATIRSGTDSFKHYIPTPVGVVAVWTQTKSATVNTAELKYLHKDHLGSTAVVTSGNGISPVQVLERLSYDPWGKRTLAQGGSAGVTSVASSTFSVGGSASGTTLTVAPGSVAAGGSVTVSWSGITAPSGSNWIGLYTPGAAAANHNGNWMYVNCTKTAGAAFPSGSCAFPIPSGLTAGGYELRLYTSSWALLASTPLTITAASSGATITVTPGSGVVAGSTLTVNWSGLPSPAASDRIGLYVAGAQSWLDWMYLSCSKTAGSASASGSCALTLPTTLANGSYEMRLLKSSGAAASFTDRGFTGHEHVKTAGDGIIHMNGRVYDANLGRFLSPDPNISAPEVAQDFNRYSYVLNNPLSLTDPSGSSWLSKAFRSIKKYIRPIIAIAVGVLTYGAASGALLTSGSGLFTTTVMGSGYTTITLSTAGYAAAGAAAGFSSGLVLGRGDLEFAGKAAVTGGISGGVAGFFGNSYSITRIAAESVVGGVNAEISGDNFRDGLRFALTVSALTYGNYKMRHAMVEQSKLNPDNISGRSGGFFEDGYKIAGARRQYVVSIDGKVVQLPCVSLMGGCQGAPSKIGDVESSFFGLEYKAGSLPDQINESFSGVHDYFRNLTGAYNVGGNGLVPTGAFASIKDAVLNYGLVVPAAPFALSGLISTSQTTSAFEHAYRDQRN